MKSKGFTLIELLAVIVILAIIALIATPIVLDIINDARNSSQLRSTDFYLNAVEHSITKKMMNDPTFKPNSCYVQSDGNLKCNETEVKVEVKGEVPTSGIVDLEKGKITDILLMFNDKIIEKQDNKLVYLESGLYDEEGNLIVSWYELVNKYGIDLEKDFVPQFDENDEVTNLSEIPGVILSSDEKLKQGTKLVIDSSVKKISNYVLSMNATIKEIIIPNSVTSIGEGAFGMCTNLEKITIPSSIKSIGDYAFDSCTTLKEIIIPNSVTSIGKGAFAECTSLTAITIPNSVTSIGSHTFQGCTKLKEISLGKNITSIGAAAFYECTSLEKITIPNSVISIGEYAIYGCTNLKEISLENNITSIGVAAFANCKNLNTINYTGTQEQWDSISKDTEWDKETPNNKVINYNYVIPQN